MDHTIISHSIILFFISMTIRLLLISESTTARRERSFMCGSNTTTFANNSQFQTNLNTLLGYLSSNSTNPYGYYQAVSSDDNSRNNEIIYGHFLCRGDLNTRDCQDCITIATKELPTIYCPNRKDSLIWYNKCMLRYSNQSFFGIYNESMYVIYAYNVDTIVGNTSRFEELIGNMLNKDIAVKAAMGGPQKKFATNIANYTILQTVYGLGQCTPDLSENDCKACLLNSIRQFDFIQQGGRILYGNCDVRYETYPFFNLSFLPLPPQPSPQLPQQAPTDTTNSNGIPTRVILAIVIPVATILLGLLVTGICFFQRKKHKAYDVVDETSEDFIDVESLQYDFAMLQSATNNFSNENKLGEGGFGGVYKATLTNGQQVAVKRLSKTSNQGVQQFKNEVLLVSKLQHRNLVRLLGFCLEGQEKLLVYEYLPNRSLDHFLFETDNQVKLDWGTRYKLIGGIARGMLYLHHDSQLKIIHRDLKVSNVLVDADMNPKISDFGMARIFGVDQSQGNTSRVVGTYGYMSPEYAMHGQFSNKSDVYSFGVLVLEIVSGKRNSTFNQSGEAEDLLSYAWKQWRDGMILEFVDPSIRDSCSNDEVTRCLHLGLLCVQESPDDRPTMAKIVLTLDSYSVTLPVPEAPGFCIKSKMESKITKEAGSDQSSSKSTRWSVNDVSITEPEAR